MNTHLPPSLRRVLIMNPLNHKGNYIKLTPPSYKKEKS